ncbi:hypothetical protein ANT2_0031 [plant metagenome]|uniref:Uncharacterized protein n=1 Tax=plant metagenome TaxID=1297885 RepID=A0A484PD58_9ZZZZ
MGIGAVGFGTHGRVSGGALVAGTRAKSRPEQSDGVRGSGVPMMVGG